MSTGLSLNILCFLLYSFVLKLSEFCCRVNGFCPGIHCQPSLIEPFLNADLDRCEIVNVHDFGPCVKSGKTIMQITQTQKDAQKPMNTAHYLQIFGQVAVSYLHLYKYLTTLWVFLWTRLVSVSRLLPSCLASWLFLTRASAYSGMTTGTRPRCLLAETGEWGCQGVTYELTTFGLGGGRGVGDGKVPRQQLWALLKWMCHLAFN